MVYDPSKERLASVHKLERARQYGQQALAELEDTLEELEEQRKYSRNLESDIEVLTEEKATLAKLVGTHEAVAAFKKASRQRQEFQPDYVVRPGRTLKDLVDESGLPWPELERRTGLTRNYIQRIIDGARIGTHAATSLALMEGWSRSGEKWPSADFWLNLEHSYRDRLARGLKDSDAN